MLMTKELLMSEIQAREQIRILRTSRNPLERVRATTNLGRLADSLREPSGTLGLDYHEAARALAEALRDRESPLIRAEAAWALGRIGGISAMRRLLARIAEVFPEPEAGAQVLGPEATVQEEPANARAALIAALGQGLSTKPLPSLDEDDIGELRQTRDILLRQMASERSDDVRVAIVETLVALSARAQEAGLDLPTDLSPLLCGEDTDAVLAAIALLKQTLPEAPQIARRWHSRSGSPKPEQEVVDLIDEWSERLGDCQPDRATLLEWLDMAAVVWGLYETAELES
jgi:hypothetical protein